MTYLIKFLRFTSYLLSAFISAIVLYITIVVFGALIPCSAADQGAEEVQIYIQSNGVHTDVCFPVTTEWYDWTTFIDPALYPLNNKFEYIAIGWGDKGFFLDTPTWAELKVSTALEAMFLPSPCAMHVEYKGAQPATANQVFEERISVDNYLAMIDYVSGSFELKDNKPIYIPGTSYWGTDHFFEAKGDYHMFNTCNSWTNGAIKSGGLRTASYAMFPDVICAYRR